MARRALRRAGRDDACGIPDARTRLPAEHSGHSGAATIELFRRHGMTPEHLDALAARGNRYRRGVPELPQTFERLLDGDGVAAGGATWRVVEGHGHSPEHASLYCAARALLISGDMLLPKISTNVARVGRRPGRRPAGALPRFADGVRAPAARHAGAAVARPAVSRHRRSRRAAARASRRAPRRARRRGRRQPPRRCRRRTSCRCCSAASSTCSSAFSRWARRSRISITFGTRAGSTGARPQTARCALPRRSTEHPSTPGRAPMSATAKTASTDATPSQGYDPVALAESLASAAEKSAKLMGDFASRHAKGGGSMLSDELGIGKAFMELAAKMLANPYRMAESQMNLWWRLHEPVAVLDAADAGRARRARRAAREGRQALQARGLGAALPVRLHQAGLPHHRALAARRRRQASRASTTARARRSISSRASTSTRWRRRTSR